MVVCNHWSSSVPALWPIKEHEVHEMLGFCRFVVCVQHTTNMFVSDGILVRGSALVASGDHGAWYHQALEAHVCAQALDAGQVEARWTRGQGSNMFKEVMMR